MQFDLSWIQAANDLLVGLVAVVGSVSGYVTAHKRGWIGQSLKTVVTEAPAIIKDVEVLSQGVGELVPAVSDAEQKLKDELSQVTANLRKSELYRVAVVGLHAFGVGVSVLSPDQKKALSYFISNHVPGVTQQEIDEALAFVQKATDEAAQSPVFVAANAYTNAQVQSA